MKFALIFVFGFFLFSIDGAAAPACRDGRPGDPIAKATADLRNICRNANSAAVEQPARGWFNMCGEGSRTGFGDSWSDIKAFGSMLKAVPGKIYDMNKSALQWEWDKVKGAYNYAFGSDPAANVNRMARQDAVAARSTLQTLRDRYEAAKLLISAYLDSMNASATIVFGSMSCLPSDWKAHYVCYAIQQITSNAVSLDGIVSAAGVAGKAAAADRLAAEMVERSGLVRKMEQLPLAKSFRAEGQGRIRGDFIASYERKTITDEGQNRAWIHEAQLASKGQSRAVFYDTENAVMKELNDKILKDKSLVTSVTNLHKQIMMRELKLLRARNPGLEVLPYSDFKSFRYAFKGKLPADLDQQVKAAFSRANRAFATEVKSMNLVRATDRPETWFKAGLAKNADEASTAARTARDLPLDHGVAVYSSAAVQTRVATYAQEVQASNQALQSNSRMRGLLQTSGNGIQLPNREVAGLVKKFNDPERLAEALRSRYALPELTRADAVELQSLYSTADRFSASLHVPKRTVVNLDEAAYGGYSADLRNVGPTNTNDLVASLAKAKTHQEMIVAARESEQRMTTLIQARLAAFKRAAGPIAKCSGDDCIGVSKAILSRADKQELLTRLASDPLTREIRMGFVRDGVTRVADRTILSTHAELIEKTMRNNLEGVLPPERLDALTFGIDMNSKATGTGEVSWLAGIGKGSPALSAEERAAVDRALSEAVPVVNTSLSKEGTKAAYRAVGGN